MWLLGPLWSALSIWKKKGTRAERNFSKKSERGFSRGRVSKAQTLGPRKKWVGRGNAPHKHLQAQGSLRHGVRDQSGDRVELAKAEGGAGRSYQEAVVRLSVLNSGSSWETSVS